MNLYEKFNCSSKEELLEKLKSEDPSVKELNEFIHFAKSNKEMDSIPLNSPDAFALYYQQYEGVKKITDDQMSLVFTNTKGRPIHHNILELDSEIELSKQLRTVMKSAFQERAAGLFIVCHEDIDKDNLQNIQFKLENLTTLDDIFYLNEDHTKIRSNRADMSFNIDIDDGLNTLSNYEYEMYQFPKYKEFTDFYSKENNIGLNIIEDIESIQENLKIGYQHENQEVGGFLFYDDTHNITNHEILFRGGINSTVIDLKVVLDYAIENEDTKGVIMFHNHPSGINLNIVS